MRVVFSDRQNRHSPPLRAIVDTGADGTLAPLLLLKQAGFRPGRQRRRLLSGKSNSPAEMVAGYLLDLKMGPLEWFDIEVYGSRELSDVIIGRNLLNQLVFTYNGPGRWLEILDS